MNMPIAWSPRPARSYRRWTPAEDKKLLLLAGTVPPDRVFAAFKGTRSPRAVEHRLREHLGLDFRRGSYSLFKLCRETGYDWRQILRARAALRQHWKRGGPATDRGWPKARKARGTVGTGHTRWLITQDQADEIIDYLAQEKEPAPRWAKQYDCCVKCGRSDRPHIGRGLCSPCHQQQAYARRASPCPTCGARPLTLARLKARAKSRTHRERQTRSIR